MDGQARRSGGGRRRRRKARNETNAPVVPVVVAARRPNSPLIAGGDRKIAASAAPQLENAPSEPLSAMEEKPVSGRVRRAARIIQIPTNVPNEATRLREHLLDRVLTSQGRGAVSKAVDNYLEEGFALPKEQAVQLQLLEHFDEERARNAILIMSQLFEKDEPIKRPVLDQRLRRLEDSAEESSTRDAAACLRRSLRS